MKTIRKNRKEDLKLLIDLGENYHGEDVTFTFSAGRYGVEKYVCSYIGGEAVNLVVTGTAMLCLLDNHRLPLGTLSVEIDIRVPDTQMPDGDFRHVTRKAAAFSIGGEQCTVELTNGASDYFPEELVPEAVINLLPTVIKGDPGQDADIEGCNQAIAAMVALTEDVEMSESKRAEAEQQRMDSEAERTAAENERKAAENERGEAETQRQTAETLRTGAENTRTEAEKTRVTKEAERTNAETARQTAESLRKSNESKRSESETARNEAEKARAAAEVSRANAEKQRAEAEKQRIVNENERKEAETERAKAEALRANNETARNNAETQRAEAERQRAAAEAARQTAESSRDEAETTRQQNETERTQAETQRAAAETERTEAENIRKQKENERQTAEQERITNNEKCVTATNTALTAAQKATTAANNATTDATNAAGEANAAAERANEAADLVYNGDPVTINVTVTSSVPAVSTAGITLKVILDGADEMSVVTNERGQASFQVPAITQYSIIYPRLGGCQDIPQTNGYAGIKTRSYTVDYKPLPEALEQLTIRLYKWTGNHNSEKFAGQTVHLTIAGETTDYITDENGEVFLEIPFGTEYTYSVDEIEGLFLYGNIYSWTYTAGVASRIRVINYRDIEIGLFFVCKDGAEFTYEEFVDSGRDGSDAVLIKIVNYDLASTGNIFGIDIDDIANGSYLQKKYQWCVSNVQFNTIPPNAQSANGLSNTINIVNEAAEKALAAPAATYCLEHILDYGYMSLQGFLPAVLQKYSVAANEKELNTMLAYVRPDATYNFTKFCDTYTWTSDQQSASDAWGYTRSASHNGKLNSYAVLPFCAF